MEKMKKSWEREKELIGILRRENKNCGRKEGRKEGKRQRVSWNSVGAEKLTWHALENPKKILSASGFNLYYRLKIKKLFFI